MNLRARTAALLALPVLSFPLLGAAPAAAEPPRPGCGYGDEQHEHQAAPGQDPEGLRPGNGKGDQNNKHTAPPGQAGDTQVEGPMRGCKDDPRP